MRAIPRQHGLSPLGRLLLERQLLRCRALEITLAGAIVFAIGFAIAARM